MTRFKKSLFVLSACLINCFIATKGWGWHPASGDFSWNGKIGRDVLLYNDCNFPVMVAIRYKNLRGNWEANGLWTVAANHNMDLASSDKRIRTDYKIFYYYAYIPEKDYYWSGDYDVTIGEKTYPMRKSEFKIKKYEGTYSVRTWESYIFSIECKDLKK